MVLLSICRAVSRLLLAVDVAAAAPAFPQQPPEQPMPQHPKYHTHLVSLMSFTLNETYDRDQLWLPSVLRSLKPWHIVRWMHQRAYGKLDVDYDTDKPTLCRATNIEFMKKAVSWYMPDSHAWTTATTPPCGNPTRAKEVHKLLAAMRKAECNGQGKAPQARRELTVQEFRKALALHCQRMAFFHVWKYPTQMRTQFSLVSRGDDIHHMKIEGLHPHPRYDFGLQTEVRWSKNVRDERACPPQILLGSMDTDFCVLLSLGIYLECWIQLGYADTSPFLFSADGSEKGPYNANRIYHEKMKEIYEDPEFVALALLIGGLLGIHSIRKFAVTFGKRVGKTADDLDVRGRWKRLGGRMIGRYIAVDQPIIDTLTCQALCVGGPIAYKVHPQAHGVTNAWLQECVCPAIHGYFVNHGNSPAHVLGKAVLWGVFDSNVSKIIPAWLVTRTRAEYEKIRTLDEGVNPIIRQPIHFFRNEDVLEFHELDPAPTTGTAAPNAPAATDNGVTIANTAAVATAGAQSAASHVATLQGVANFSRLQQVFVDRVMVVVRELKQQLTQSDIATDNLVKGIQLIILQELQKMNNNICRIAVQPPRMATPTQRAAMTNTQQPARLQRVRPPTLQKNVRELGLLWTEWTHGLGGAKAAKDFTPQERGTKENASRFSRRLPIWLLMSKLVNAGNLVPEAIRRIQAVYPGVSLINLGRLIKADIRAKRLHPDLTF